MIHPPAGFGGYRAVSGWNTFTCFRSSPRYSLSFGPNIPNERQIKVHKWTTG